MIHRTQMAHASTNEISSSLGSGHSECSLLPSFLLEMSNRSMEQVDARSFTPRQVSVFSMAAEDEMADTHMSSTFALNDCSDDDYRVIPLQPSGASKVVAIDVSSLKIGETESGVLVAIRGAVTWRSDHGYEYLRCGPLTFHLKYGTDEGSSVVLPGIETSHLFTERAISRLRNTLERWIQKQICISFEEAIVLFDGSLTVGTPDNPTAHLARILEYARERENVVLAFSKGTKLCAFGKKITSLVSEISAPCLLDVDRPVTKQFGSYPVRLAGHVYVAKLVEDGFAFRLDADRTVPVQVQVETVNRLLTSDIVMQGYPETLRLAHIFSTFTANEVIAIQRYLASAHGFRITPHFNVRKSLFGPFGSWEAS